MALRFLIRHRPVIVPREELTTLAMLASRLDLQYSEISRNDVEVMVLMSDEDCAKLKEYNETHKIVPASWDGS